MNGFLTAETRFCYGVSQSATSSEKSRDAQGWLIQQVRVPEFPAALRGLPLSSDIVMRVQQFRQEKRIARQEASDNNPGFLARLFRSKAKPDGDAQNMAAADPSRQALAETFLAEVNGRVVAATTSETPLVERLTAFWANHFTVSGVRPEVRPIAGSFEREAIRPHVTGRFHDMLMAVIQHPAMLLYLDNAFSVGPNSRAGQRSSRGINENLGRELLELHTLGVNGGYTEEDVRSLALVLTGWSVARPRDPNPGTFYFYSQLHEPGAKTLLGTSLAEGGMDEGLQALEIVANHPSTARHIAIKVARHFVSDDPPSRLVDRLARAFMDSHGDLAHVTETLIRSPEPWRDSGSKVKTPYDLVISSLKATGFAMPAKQVANSLNVLGQPLFTAPSPAGWPDDSGSWIGPEAILRRIQWVQSLAERIPQHGEPQPFPDVLLASAGTADLEQAIGHADSRQTALALFLASPTFQRR